MRLIFSSMLSPADSVKHSSRVAYRDIKGQIVIVLPIDNALIVLNETGSAVWRLLDGQTIEAVAGSISSKYKVSEDQALQDTIAFLNKMEARGLIESAQSQ
jgi:hypothetical protein